SCWALSGHAPGGARPPVSDTQKPILMGSCACTEKSAPDNVTAAATSSDIRGRAFSAILILHPFIASSPVRQNEPTHRAFEADDTSDLVGARKPRCERDARWDRARCREGPRTEWAPHNRTVYFAFSPACSAFMGGAACDRV